jgi:hypothetical protein
MIRGFTAAFTAHCAGALIVFALASPAAAQSAHIINKDRDNIAIRGYDTVAYFTEKRAVEGKPEFEHKWQDARWLFANAAHRDLFAQDSERYVPRFGGFCTGGMALNYIQEPNPENWAIIDGRLYFNTNSPPLDRRENPQAVINAAEGNWVELGQQYDPAARRPCTTCAGR